MEITFIAFHSYPRHKALQIAKELKHRIDHSPTLTPRSMTHLYRQVKDGRSVLAYANDQLVGSLVVYPVSARVYEIQSLLVDSSHRRKGIAKQMIGKVIDQFGDIVILANTFEPEVMTMLKQLGFTQSAFQHLTLMDKVRYICSRSYYSLWKHFLVKKAVLLCYSKHS